jgi:hypothetical protein
MSNTAVAFQAATSLFNLTDSPVEKELAGELTIPSGLSPDERRAFCLLSAYFYAGKPSVQKAWRIRHAHEVGLISAPASWRFALCSSFSIERIEAETRATVRALRAEHLARRQAVAQEGILGVLNRFADTILGPQAPVAQTQASVAQTQAPVAQTQAPVAQTQAPATPPAAQTPAPATPPPEPTFFFRFKTQRNTFKERNLRIRLESPPKDKP